MDREPRTGPPRCWRPFGRRRSPAESAGQAVPSAAEVRPMRVHRHCPYRNQVPWSACSRGCRHGRLPSDGWERPWYVVLAQARPQVGTDRSIHSGRRSRSNRPRPPPPPRQREAGGQKQRYGSVSFALINPYPQVPQCVNTQHRRRVEKNLILINILNIYIIFTKVWRTKQKSRLRSIRKRLCKALAPLFQTKFT